MNRDKRRKFAKEAKKKGIPDEYINAYLAMVGNGIENKDIKEDEKVLLDVDRIISNNDYKSMNDRYKDFIQNCKGEIFTAHIEDSGLISLKENPEWLFFKGDLIKYIE